MNSEEGGFESSLPHGKSKTPINTRIKQRFVEFETASDLKTAVEKLDGREFKGARVTCVPDVRAPSRPGNAWKEILMSILDPTPR